MTLMLDASALLAAVVDGQQRATLIEALTSLTATRGVQDDDAARSGAQASDAQLCASALALTEALAAVDRLTDEAVLRADMEDELRRLWDHVHVVPVDQRCLDEAARLARERPIRVSDAVHFAAANRLPPPIRFVTVDPTQVAVALGLGYDVVSP